jgi:hypothetical protein
VNNAVIDSPAFQPFPAASDGEIACLDNNGCSQFNPLLFHRGFALREISRVPEESTRASARKPSYFTSKIQSGVRKGLALTSEREALDGIGHC